MKRKKRNLKLIALLLTLSLSLSLLEPYTALAQELSGEQLAGSAELWKPETEAANPQKISPVLPLILEEDTTKRDIYEKHFLCDDGSYLAVTYPEPVHALKDGVWEDIDYAPAIEGERIVSRTEDGEISLPLQLKTEAKHAEIIAGEHTISWTVETRKNRPAVLALAPAAEEQKLRPLPAEQKVQALRPAEAELSSGQILQEPSRVEADAQDFWGLFEKKEAVQEELNERKDEKWSPTETKLLDGINSEIRQANQVKIEAAGFAEAMVEYPQALGDGAELRYMLSPGKVKEELVISSPDVLDAYVVRLNAAGLTAALDEVGGVILCDDEKTEVVRIAPPLLYDAADMISEEVEVELEQEGDQWVVTYTPDRAWLEAPEREWPVVIDPTVTSSKQMAQNTLLDNYVYEGQTRPVDPNGSTMYVGYYTRNGSAREHRTYWRMKTLPRIPDQSEINSVSFHIRMTNGTTTMCPISLYRIEHAWDSSTVTWDNKPGGPINLGQKTSVPSGTAKWLVYDGALLTATVRGWYDNPSINNGLALQYEGCMEDYNCFYSSDYRVKGDLSFIPYMTIRYTAPSEISQVCLQPSTLTLDEGDSYYFLNGSVLPSNAPQRICYTSSDPNIVSVDYNTGTLCANGPGIAIITARSAADSSKYDTSFVTVNKQFERVELSYSDSLFISQLINPDVSFNQPGSKYAFDFDRAYALLQVFKNANPRPGHSLVSGKVLEDLGYCEKGAGAFAEALFNSMYGNALSGKTMLDQAIEDSARWQAQLNIALGFMYQKAIFKTQKNFVIRDNTFNPNSRLDMIEKDLLQNGYVYKMASRTLHVTYKESGPFRAGSFQHVFLGQQKGGAVSGYHYEGIQGAVGQIEPGTKTTPNRYGVYEARVVNKNGKSSFFPSSMTPDEIIDEMSSAYHNRTHVEKNTWKCYFSNGMEVRFYLDQNNKIISFFPWYNQ